MNLISLICIAIVATLLAGVCELFALVVRRRNYAFRRKRFGVTVLVCAGVVLVLLYWRPIFGLGPAQIERHDHPRRTPIQNNEDSNNH